MQIVANPELREKALQVIRDEYMLDVQRPGIHQSELSYCLTRAYWNKTDPVPPTDKEVLLFSIGFGLERVYLRGREAQPEPIEIDGITMSLDTMDLFGPADLKSTRKRAEQSNGCAVCGEPYRGHGGNGHTYQKSEPVPFEFPEGWKRQAMAYRYALNKTMCQCGHPLAIHEGDYCNGGPLYAGCVDPHRVEPAPAYTFSFVVIHLIEPEITTWTITFTPEELENNWQRLLTRKEWLERMLESNNPNPFQSNEDWECENCTYKTRCELVGSMQRLQNVVSMRRK